MKFNGFIGGAYKLDNVALDCQRCVNLYADTLESGSSREAQRLYLKCTDALKSLMDLDYGTLRLIHVDGLETDENGYFQPDRMFVVSAEKVFRLTYESSWTVEEVGSLNTTTGKVHAASSAILDGVTVFVDGSNDNYAYEKTGPTTETFRTFAAAGYSGVPKATKVRWLDGFFIFIVQNSNTYYVSDVNALTVDPLSFAKAEGDPDSIVSIAILNRDAWLFNKRTIEVFNVTGGADFPLDRVAGGFIECGCLAPDSVAKIGGTLVWLGRDENGQGMIFAAKGIQPFPISTNAINAAISNYADTENATAYAYQKNGNMFYVINFEETSWCYDFKTKLWHERCWTDETTGALERHRAQFCVFFPDYGKHILGDYENSKLYEYSDKLFQDNGNTITRIRTAPHVSNNFLNIFFKRFYLDMKVGVGKDGLSTVLGANPKIMLRWSDDGGFSWSNEYWKEIGKIGERLKRVFWDQLGMARDRVFELTFTDPCELVIYGADLDLETAGR
jgi:hypothetical protein